MRALLLTLIVVSGVGCQSKQPPNFTLTIGSRTYELASTEPREVEDEVIAKLKSVWDSIETGTSEPFFVTRTDFYSNGSGIKTEMGPLRMFKDPGGETGLEAIIGGVNTKPDFHATDVFNKWKDLEARLRERLQGTLASVTDAPVGKAKN